MKIESTLTNQAGEELALVYRESDPLEDLADTLLQGVHAFCFCGDLLVVVYAEDKGYWMVPGGAIEPGEHYEEAVVREVREETNMEVVYQELIGYQDVYEKNRTIRQTRSFCIVEPIGPFVEDPDGEITEVKLIEPADYKKYFDWGDVGEHIMNRALEMKREFDDSGITKK